MDEKTQPAPAPGKPSQVPSWVTLGFALGALFVLALPRRSAEDAGPRPRVEPAPAAPPKAAEAPRIATIEAVFAAWDRYAVWSNDTTQVALWNPDTKGFSDYFEVYRAGDGYYFRTLTSLTRPVLTHGVVDESPLQFTETLRQREEWLADVRKENWKAFSEGVQKQAGTPAPVPQKP